MQSLFCTNHLIFIHSNYVNRIFRVNNDIIISISFLPVLVLVYRQFITNFKLIGLTNVQSTGSFNHCFHLRSHFYVFEEVLENLEVVELVQMDMVFLHANIPNTFSYTACPSHDFLISIDFFLNILSNRHSNPDILWCLYEPHNIQCIPNILALSLHICHADASMAAQKDLE